MSPRGGSLRARLAAALTLLLGVSGLFGGPTPVLADEGGTVVAWGYNGDGQAGVPAGLTGVTAIAAGVSHSLALKADGTVVAWGANGSGQTDVPAGLTNVVAIAGTWAASLALKSDGTIVGWGSDYYNERGPAATLSGVTAIAAGDWHGLALKSDRTVVAWGTNWGGESAVPVGLSGVAAIAAGGHHSLALRADGTVVAWGTVSSVPAGLSDVVAISAGGNHNLALRADGTVAAWGDDTYGQTDVPAGLTGVVAVSAGYAASLALKADGTVVAWGTDGYRETNVPAGLTGVVAISAGGQHELALVGHHQPSAQTIAFDALPNVTYGSGPISLTATSSSGLPVTYVAGGACTASGTTLTITGPGTCAVTAGQAGNASYAPAPSVSRTFAIRDAAAVGGTVVAWGNDSAGQADVPAGLTDVVAVGAGGMHSLAVRSDGTVAAWGNDVDGETNVPAGLSNVVAVAGAWEASLALRADGTIVGWGLDYYNTYGPAASLSHVVAIAAGDWHALALESDGTVVAWGTNWGGESDVPAGLSGVAAIAAGGHHSLALKSDGTVVAWGTVSDVPAGLSDVVAIAAGTGHDLALRADGTVVAWGDDSSGQADVPAGLSHVVAVAAGGNDSLALKADGTVVSWGAPAVPAGLNGVVAIAAGAGHGLAVVHGSRPALTISASAATKRYGAALPDLTATYAGFVDGDTAADLGGALSCATTATASSPVGTYPITCSGLTSARYSITYVGGTLTVTPSGPPPATGDWPEFRNGPAHEGHNTVETTISASNAVDLGVAWTATIGSAIWSSPAVADGVVYIGSQDGKLYAYAVGCASGGGSCSPLWTATTGDRIDASPAVGDGVVYVGSHDAKLYAYAVGCNSGGGSCSPLWTATTGGTIDWSSPAVADGVVYIGSDDGKLHAYAVGCRSDGGSCTPLWTATTGFVPGYGQLIYSSPAVADGVVYVGSLDGKLNAYAVGCAIGGGSCTPLWTGSTGSYIYTSSPAVADGVVYIGSRDGKLYAFAVGCASGGGSCAPLWTATTGDRIHSSPAVANGVVYVGSEDGKLYAYSVGCRSDGGSCTPLWTATTGSYVVTSDHIDSSPAVAEGVVYVGSEDGKLYAFGLPVTPEPTPQTITFDALPDVTYGVEPITLAATATSGLPVGFSTTGACTLAGTTLTVTGTGACTVTASQGGDASVAPATPVSRTLSVAKAPLTITADDRAKGYGAALPDLAAGYAGFVNGDTAADLGDALACTTTATAASPVGRYPITCSGLASPNYAISYLTGTLTVAIGGTAVRGTVVAWGYDGLGETDVPAGLADVVAVYAGANHNLALKADGTVAAWGYNGAGEADVPAGLAGVVAVAASGYASFALKADGTVVGWGDNYYNETGPTAALSHVIAIAAGDWHGLALRSDGTVAAWGGEAWGGTDVPAGLSGVVAIAAGGNHNLALRADGTVAAWGTVWPAPADVPAGLSDVVAIAAGTNHDLALKADGTVVAWGDDTYGQTDVPAGLSGVVAIAGGYGSSLALKADGTVVAWGTNWYETDVPAGLNGVVAIADGSSNGLALVHGSRPALSVSASDAAKPYGAALPDLAAAYTGFVDGDTAAVLDGSLSCTTTATATSPVGSYPVTCSGLTSAKYFITYAPGTLTVAPAPLTITADDATRPYGAPNPAFTAADAGFVNGETGSVLGGTLACSATATIASPVGTYPITCAGLTSSNYAIAYAAGVLTIAKVPLAVTVANATKAAGAPNPAFAVAYAGFVSGETSAVLGGALVFTTTAATSSPAGTYPVTASGLTSPNYAIAYVAGTLTVTPSSSPQTITFAALPDRTYGAAPSSLSATATSGLPVAFTASGACAVSGTTLSITGAGACAVTASQAGNASWAPANPVLRSFTVARAALTVTANAKSKVYGAASPPLTSTTTGFANGETGAVLGGSLSCTTTAAAASPAGSYPITCGGLTSPNYAITYVAGSLTVTKAPLTVTVVSVARAYSTANPAFTVTYAGFVSGETSAALGGSLAFATTAVTASPVGTYPVTASGRTSPNYAITYVAGTLTVVIADHYATPVNTTLNVAAPGFLALTTVGSSTVVVSTNPAHGTLTLVGAGGFKYVPASGYIGQDSFAWKLKTGSALSAATTVKIAVVGGGLSCTSGCDLSGLVLSGASLGGANLTGANLTGTVLGHATLTGANLTNAVMAGANLNSASLGGSSLTGANLTGATITNATLTGANLSNATLANANLSGSNLSGANLSGDKLSGANLSNTNLTGANLSGATLTNAIFTGANAAGANLRNAKATGATFTGATVTGIAWPGSTCPDGTLANNHGSTCTGHLVP